ncbi:6-phosphogluconate dehydrogenase [Fructilactobacillus lindneri]|nr:NAD(P)/FAD-dependent oxidoreductase [Fructilactobacillus lindneri]POH07869.1 6-phosphogluconate dehydrogenase [Fructilactobacillus lindneri]POH08029.1 6-phosphogluconate dehydrogenase [Fructilactobacillus lindneri]POH24543.1 6-phosphogluconate dehydrogenase [Fructilactobacillus lindneri DSM 20690 = JCM 11027]SJZ71690.1 NADH dehydrogenase [Fructilactobacillus lindneri DSM 20690 = JCM 11027]
MTDVLVLGAGYAGLRACKQLAKSKLDLNITLVNKNSYNYDATALETVAAGATAPENIMMDIADVTSNKVHFIQDEVEVINRNQNSVVLKNSKQELKYDYLFNALGFEPETFGTPGADEYALQISNIDNAVADYETVVKHLETYQKTGNKDYLSMVVVGGGLTSAELLGELVHQIPKWARKYGFDKADFQLTCIGPNLLSMFDEKQRAYAQRYLEKHGVKFILGQNVKSVSDTGVIYGDNNHNLPARTVFWTAGVSGSHVIEKSGYPEHRDRVAVNDDMTSPTNANEYIIGDVAAVKDQSTGRFYPPTGQIAIQEANIAVANLKAKLTHSKPVPFTYRSLGTVCSLGPTTGIAYDLLGFPIKLTGILVPTIKNLIFKRSAFELSGLKAALQR